MKLRECDLMGRVEAAQCTNEPRPSQCGQATIRPRQSRVCNRGCLRWCSNIVASQALLYPRLIPRRKEIPALRFTKHAPNCLSDCLVARLSS